MTPMLAWAALLVSGSLVLSILVKATLIAVAVLAYASLARRQRASVRHLWLAAGFCVLLALPLSLAAGRSGFFDLPVAVVSTAVPTSADTPPATVDEFFETASAAVAAPRAVTGTPMTLSRLLLVAWAVGAGLFLLPVLAGLYQMRRYHRVGMPLLREQATLSAFAETLAIRRPVRLLLHESIAGPLTYGVIRPVVFLPRDSKTWEAAALRRALIHELEHVRRADWLVHCASRIVCALYWFHPLVWAMWRKLALEAERACDDAVLRESEPTQYADQLVDLAERLSLQARPPLLAMAGRDELMTRVLAVLDPTLPRGRAGYAGAALAVSAVVAVAGVAPLRAVPLSLPAAPLPVMRIVAGMPPLPDAAIAPALVEVEPAVQAQAPAPPAARPSFAVASVKINNAGPRGGGGLANMGGTGAPPSVGGRYVRTNIPVDVLIATAYGPLQRFEIDQVPEWTTMTRVDVDARADGNPTPQQFNQMLQSLLAERFTLVVHREARPQPLYALTVARPGQVGPQLKAHTNDDGCVDPRAALPNVNAAIDPARPLPPAPCGAFRGNPAIGRMAGQDVPLEIFGRALSGQLGRMVVDRTGLMGNWDLLMEWTPLQQLPGVDPPAVGTPDRPSIFTAMQEQLGLKLEPTTGPVNLLVVDHVEPPTEN